ncbi:MAG: SsrA-binding protein SmpB [Bacteroidetes bacterium]|nr:SsrA-binding protein SmpB [Bacteroidota bacterium]MCK6612318.1 SsrA-binding protein SmpB [Bacteroidia bacterium]
MSKSTYKSVNILNKKASFEYHILQKFVAGIELMGTEVKSIRLGNASISEAFCFFKDNELFVRGMNIGTFKQGTHYNHDTLRIRKLLLKRSELSKLQSKASETGISIVPLKVFEGERGYLKMEIALAQGKKAFDKRESIKERDVERNMRRNQD